MQPAPQKHSEVVYRKTGPGSSRTTFAERARGYAPAITPLVVGFLLLLAVILVLGLRSAAEMDNVASDARIRTQAYSTRLSNLLNLRLTLTELNNEARLRDAAEARRELTPPLELKLDQARDEAKTSLNNLGEPPPGKEDEKDWNELKSTVQSYIEVTRDRREYNQKGLIAFPRLKRASTKCSQTCSGGMKRLGRRWQQFIGLPRKPFAPGSWLRFLSVP